MKATKWVVSDKKQKHVYWPSKEMKARAWISSEKVYAEADKNPTQFWGRLAKEGITWFKHWNKTYEWKKPYSKWFLGGKLNACHNAVDRHLETHRKNKVAIIWEPEPINEPTQYITYYQLHKEVSKFANVLKKLGVKKGDRVGIYLPMIPEAQIAMLACARIGAIHSVVFSAFSGESLKKRLIDGEAKILITADGYYRRGKPLNLKSQADFGAKGTKVKKVIVVNRTGAKIKMTKGRDYYWNDLMKTVNSECPVTVMNSEDPLFILYTSGTTGTPKGVIHDTGGYLTQAYWTTKLDFDLHDDDVFWCTADVGWITGHTYSCYGPLSVGATIVTFEGAPDFPDPGRFWSIIEKYGVNVFYTAPTVIRMFARFGEEWPKKYDLTSLRILGTVGEPIDLDAWLWYFKIVGGSRCPIIDTWWQTETGGTLINVLPGVGPFIPMVAGRSFPGIRHKVLDAEGKEVKGKEGYLFQDKPFAPGLLHGVWKNSKRYKKTYWSKHNGEYYDTSDGAKIIKGKYIRMTGRTDDVMKVAGHRLATAELENAINLHKDVSESGVVPIPHKIKGEVPLAFVILEPKAKPSDELTREIISLTRKIIGPTAKPEKVFYVKDLPKTRSGKIMRRILKRLLNNEPAGDISTLRNPESVAVLKSELKKLKL
ncbi:MAG: acetate--CoA ligase [Nanoarchaeota archaeon]|nr:acetate--CoA ligase [Nanoarchaeota archaeon]